MIIKENGRSYCTAEHMTIKLIDTAELDFPAVFAIKHKYRTPLDAWTFATQERETLCVNKAHPDADRLAELAGRFVELSPEDDETDAIFRDVDQIAGEPATLALLCIAAGWHEERASYKNHLAALDYVRKMRESMQAEEYDPCIDVELLRAIYSVSRDFEEAIMLIYLYGREKVNVF